MKRLVRVLILEDSEDDTRFLLRELREAGFSPRHVRAWSARQMQEALQQESWDIVLSDYSMPGFTGPEALALLKETGRDIPFIMVSGAVGEEAAVEVMRQGASDYLLKDRLSRLGFAVSRALQDKEAREEAGRAAEALRASEERFAAFMAHLPAFAWIKDRAGRYVYTNRAFEQLVSQQDLIGKTDEEIWPSEFAAQFRENDERVWRGKEVHEMVERFSCAGRMRVALVRKFPIADKHGELLLLGGVAIETTERLEAAERLQTLSRRLIEVQELERRAIARELHDHVGQLLTACKINLQEARRFSETPRVHQRLDDSLRMVDELLNEARRLSLDLRPPLLDELGLEPTLEWFLQRQEERSGLKHKLLARGVPESIDPTIETTCFRVVQEAITNVLRHARATEVVVELAGQDGWLRLSVSDNGVGFDTQEARQRTLRGGSMGLLSMEERVRLTGGTFSCESLSERGTRIEAVLPISGPGVQASYAESNKKSSGLAGG